MLNNNRPHCGIREQLVEFTPALIHARANFTHYLHIVHAHCKSERFQPVSLPLQVILLVTAGHARITHRTARGNVSGLWLILRVMN